MEEAGGIRPVAPPFQRLRVFRRIKRFMMSQSRRMIERINGRVEQSVGL